MHEQSIKLMVTVSQGIKFKANNFWNRIDAPSTSHWASTEMFWGMGTYFRAGAY